jgi:hypothetical protein
MFKECQLDRTQNAKSKHVMPEDVFTHTIIQIP